MQGQALPDLRVRISQRVTEAGVQGVLGITFLGLFEEVHFHVTTLRLTLTAP